MTEAAELRADIELLLGPIFRDLLLNGAVSTDQVRLINQKINELASAAYAPKTKTETGPTRTDVSLRWGPPANDPLLLDDLDSFLRRAAFEIEDLRAAEELVNRIRAGRGQS
jgi:hypothetical protein